MTATTCRAASYRYSVVKADWAQVSDPNVLELKTAIQIHTRRIFNLRGLLLMDRSKGLHAVS